MTTPPTRRRPAKTTAAPSKAQTTKPAPYSETPIWDRLVAEIGDPRIPEPQR